MDNKVYITTNLINGKKYIGSTNGKNIYYKGSGALLKKSIAKYGINNFVTQTLWSGPSEYMREMEEYWIEYFDASNNQMFYNISNKGVGKKTFRTIEDEKEYRRNYYLTKQKGKYQYNKNYVPTGNPVGPPRKYKSKEEAKLAQRAQTKAWNKQNG